MDRICIDNLFTTCGYHPTRCNEFNDSNENEILNQMMTLLQKHSNKIIAIGEFGLDYERTQFCDVDQQKRYAFLNKLSFNLLFN